MRSKATLVLLIFTVVISTSINTTVAQSSDLKPNKSEKMVVQGYVRDLACLMKFNEALKPTNDCAMMCARAGSPLVLITEKGEIYTAISESVPDVSQREKLMPFVGSYVEASGDVFHRAGINAIVIRQIQKAE